MREPWLDAALCAGTTSRIWFRKEGDAGSSAGEKARVQQAKGWCERCPVRRECLTYALEWEQPGEPTVQDMPVFALVRSDGDEIVSIRYERRRFSASHTPPVGIYGGFQAHERPTRNVKHYEGCVDRRCSWCRPVSERVELLLGPDGRSAPRARSQCR